MQVTLAYECDSWPWKMPCWNKCHLIKVPETALPMTQTWLYTNNSTIFKQLTHYFDGLICKCGRYNTLTIAIVDFCLEAVCMGSVGSWCDRPILWKICYDLCLRLLKMYCILNCMSSASKSLRFSLSLQENTELPYAPTASFHIFSNSLFTNHPIIPRYINFAENKQ
jgi:hypothetical protein